MPPLMLLILMLGITMSTIFAASSHHWLMAWLGLELNTLCLLPLISKPKHPRATEATTKYFLTQAIASTLVMFSSTMNAWETGQWHLEQLSNNFACILMTIALMIKVGTAPMHFWLPEVLQGSTMQTALLITTWQKIAPIALLYSMANHMPIKMTMMLGITSILIGGWGGINQTQTRKLLAFSSIAHMGWTLMIITISPNIAVLNIMIYITMTTPTFLLLIQLSMKTLKDAATAWTTTPTIILLMPILMSLGGLPPLTGFTPKLLILNEMVAQNMTPMATIAALASLLSLMFYLRMAYLATMTLPPITTTSTMKWRLTTKSMSIPLAMTTTMTMMNLPMTPALIP
uniref:NADH-ubiquinone oxidoreductase chain 2 n=1 Tax=Leiolepis guttata TaxID=181671 RepID=D6RS49_9SAUR|nr:NADH dehydrogenase subunit 2 [Leiolepis guttata]BAJ08139.1 NADH dehydrogenase subunit 2 [Leiolepis guttata]